MCNLHPDPPLPTPSQGAETQRQTIEPSSAAGLQLPSSTGGDAKKLIVIGIAATVGAVVVIAVLLLSGFWCWSHRNGHQAVENVNPPELEGDGLMQCPLSGTPDPEIDLSSMSLIQKIGGGRFSEVWKASLNRKYVAVKIFPKHEKQSWNTEKDVYTNPEIKHDFLRTFLSAAERHLDGDLVSYWMILDFHDLGSLCDYLKTHLLMLEDLCKMAGSVAAGLAYLHSESVDERKLAIAHRDLKSRNILVKRDGTCCISDLGLSLKFQPGTSLTEALGQVSSRSVCFSVVFITYIHTYYCMFAWLMGSLIELVRC